MPVFPNDTRWKSQHDCLDSYLKNRPYYTAIASDHADEFDKTIRRKVMEEAIVCNATDLRDQLKPVAVALDWCQSNLATIADFCESFLYLLENPVLEPDKAAVTKRFKKAILPCHFAAATYPIQSIVIIVAANWACHNQSRSDTGCSINILPLST